MGYLRHECIVVYGWDAKEVLRSHGKACRIFNKAGYGRLVSEIKPDGLNGGAAFFVAPDGSKEGWEPSNKCADARDKLISFLKTTTLDWVLVLIGGDDGEYCVLASPNGEHVVNAAGFRVPI